MPLHRFDVHPEIPAELEPIHSLAKNLAWTYDNEIRRFFVELAGHLNQPVGDLPPAQWINQLSLSEQRQLSQATALVVRAKQLLPRLKPETSLWPAGEAYKGGLVAYFSAEFGLHESLPIYAGGLGILAGDHLKSAGNQGLPLIGIGLFYHNGYHEQRLSPDGSVSEYYVRTDLSQLGASICTLPDGGRLTVSVQMAHRLVSLQIWRLEVSGVSLLLLDSDIPENSASDRQITAQLYGGDLNIRIEQELALGIGGVFALEALGFQPSVFHMNEGHAAFLSIARLHQVQRELGIGIAAAAEIVAAANVFTTHTPVAAGNDVFSHEALLPYLIPLTAALSVPLDWLLGLGREVPGIPSGAFSMTAFALNLAARKNGVSKEHGLVSRRLWHKLWPGRSEGEVPIGAVVNGVHLPTWSAPSLANYYTGAESVDPSQFWSDKNQLRGRLIQWVKQHQPERGAKLSPAFCTIGFARRFAEYKRALMLFSDPDRLRRLLFDPDRPMQLLFAGKAHPNNQREKANIKRFAELVQQHNLGERVVFVENYNMAVARLLVQGVDVWLNTPRPPLEASGTSGMKIVLNGGLNVSVRDGWWKEAFEPGVGWAIGSNHESGVIDEEHAAADRDSADAASLYAVLEREVLPLFYQRASDGVPREWVKTCIRSGQVLSKKFSSHRMVADYLRDYYLPAHEHQRGLLQGRGSAATKLAEARTQLEAAWPQVSLELLTNQPKDLKQGVPFKVRAKLVAGNIPSEQLRVEVLVGQWRNRPNTAPPADDAAQLELAHAQVFPTTLQAGEQAGQWTVTGELTCDRSGENAFAVRVMPTLNGARALPLVVLG